MLSCLLAGTAPAAWVSNASAGTRSSAITATCPGPTCLYTPPTAIESGAATDVLARMNLERAQSERNYPYGNTDTVLPKLDLASSAGQQTAQAAAEWEAAHQTVSEYAGERPPGYSFGTGGNASDGDDSAGIDNAIMHSYGHALGVLSAAPTDVAIGVACSENGKLYITEQFYNLDQPSWQAGQNRFRAELAANNVYVASNGTITSVPGPTGPAPAQDYLPQQPIVAGYGTGDSGLFATGVDWTCGGAKYSPGSSPSSPLPAPITGIAASQTGGGYALVNAQGAISVHGDANFHGAANGMALTQPIDHIVATPDGGGYWLVAGDGGIFSYGDAGFFGSLGDSQLDAPVVGMAPTPDGRGYWLVGRDGGVFAFGDAPFVGSMGGRPLNAPIVGMTASPSGTGYRLVASDGGIFAFGEAFFGSTAEISLNKPVVGMANTTDGDGYWLVASDGGIFAFGDAAFRGSTGALSLVQPIVGIAANPTTGGYWLGAADGGVFAFGSPFYGSD